MFISHKSNTIIAHAQVEWECRQKSKGLSLDAYWAWIKTITSGDPPVIDYSGETGYTIVECTDEDVDTRLGQLDDYINQNREPGEARVYNIKYYASKRDAEEILDNEGNSHDPKQYVSSHFVGDDTARDARLLVSQWDLIRIDRNRRLSETDYLALSDQTLSDDMKTYRQELRDVPSQSDPDNITWPTKP